MKIALIPEGGVLLTNLIFKNGHTPLQMYNMTPEKAREKAKEQMKKIKHSMMIDY